MQGAGVACIRHYLRSVEKRKLYEGEKDWRIMVGLKSVLTLRSCWESRDEASHKDPLDQASSGLFFLPSSSS